MKFSTPIRIIVPLLLLTFAASTGKAQNFGDLLVTPLRVVFEGNNRSQALTLFNIGGDTATYQVSFIQYRMNLDGTFTEIEDPDAGQIFADPYLRFFPRTVTLLPKEAQTVRLQFRPAPGMPEGEYRSHLFFRSVKKQLMLSTEASADDTTALAINVSAIYGVSIPVIVRRGELTADVSLSEIALRQNEDSLRTQVLSLELRRQGSMSTFGDLLATYISGSGEETLVGEAKGVAVYTPNSSRSYELPLRVPEGIPTGNGRLRIEYLNRTDLKEKMLAVQEVPFQ